VACGDNQGAESLALDGGLNLCRIAVAKGDHGAAAAAAGQLGTGCAGTACNADQLFEFRAGNLQCVAGPG
jgi:hypothetical protein